MLPTRLELRNFLAYRQLDELKFDGIHVACLSGPNGAGKSSLLDAITWALWGRARVRSDDDLIHQGQTEMLVQLDFLQGDHRYRVVRKRQKRKSARGAGHTTLDLFVWDDELERWQPISAPGLRETDQRIIDLLRLDYETFVHSAFLQQGKADAFTVKPAAERKDLLSGILGLSQWKDYEARAKDRVAQIAHELDIIAHRVREIDEQEQQEPALRRELDTAEAGLIEAEHVRAEAEARYAEVAGAQDQMDAATARLAGADHRIRQRQRDLDEIEIELARYRQQLDDLGGIVAERDAIQAGFEQLQAARDADQALGEKLQSMAAIKDRLAEVTSAIQARRAELEAQATVHRDRIASAQRAAGEMDAIQTDLADVQSEVEQLAAQEERRDTLRDTVAALGEESAALKAENKALYTEMKALETRINQLKEAEAVCPLCGQPLDGENKAALLDQLTIEGTARGDAYRANVSRRDDIAEQLRASREESEALEIELRVLPAKREHAAVLGATLDTARSAADTLREESAALDVLKAALDSGEYAHELQAQRDAIQAEIDALGYDSEAHSAARETLAEFSEYERRQRDLDAALRQMPDIQTALDSATTRRDRWLIVLDEERAEAEAARAEIAALAEQVEEARRREDEVRQRRTAEKRAQEAVIRCQQALAALDNARKRRADLERRHAELSAEKNLYETLRDAFGKNGVPAMIIEAAIPELEEAANAPVGAYDATGGCMSGSTRSVRRKAAAAAPSKRWIS